jgi:DNA-binding transcriptional ArsR family regulator
MIDMKGVIDVAAAEGAFAALGNRTRIEILRLLVRAGSEGLAVGEIQAELEMPGSTLSHHIDALARAGLILREPRGREVICTSNYGRLRALSEFLMESCCAGVEKRERRRAA